MADIPGNTTTTSNITGTGAYRSDLEFSGDSDWWRMSLTSGLTYMFRVESGGGPTPLDDAYLVLRDSNGNEIKYVNDGYNLSFTAVQSGTYYLEVVDSSSDGKAEGTYVINTWMGDTVKGNTTTTASISASGQTAGQLGESGDSDWYRLTMVEGRSYSFSVVSGGGTTPLDDAYLVLRDANGNEIKYVNDGYNLIFTASQTGVYYLDVQDSSSDGQPEGNFIIKSSMKDTVVANTSTTAVIKAGYETVGAIDAVQDVDWYRLNTQNGVTYEVTLSGTGAAALSDNKLILLDANGNVISYDYGSSRGAALLTFKATSAGPYFLAVRSDSDYDADTGSFLLSVRSDAKTIVGTSGNDVLSGMDNDNIINGGAGHDVLRGNGGNDLLIGGLGNDGLLGGLGHDTADYRVNTTVIVNLGLTGGQQTGQGKDSLHSIEGVISGSGSDLLTGNAANNTLDAGLGNDRVDGAAGNDTLIGGHGNDVILGGAGEDTLAFAAGGGRTVNLMVTTAQVTGEGTDRIVGVEHIAGTNLNDSFTGSTGNNRLDGAGGNDMLNAAAGNDTLLGGLGNDTINGGAGVDWLVMTNNRGTAVDLVKTGAQSTGEGVDIILGIENVAGAGGNDRIFGSALANTLKGGNGNDLLDGRGGIDRLQGDDGRDTLRGGTGNDVLTGGDDEDVFFFEAGGGFDRITDFDDGDDLIEFRSGANAYSDLTITQVGADTHITYGGTNKVIVAKTYYWDLDQSDFIFS
ncbi:pre-peptidase C-terminal domain-containing protein [Paracoccus sp. S1E-3]|uniref:calcium-binding protein n=1 Tax=Paracoccus sp. S1E-3 TaxID=2756130 RepID=UPI0015EF00DB|nr:pre-peptidase C-terminal domain-containing protein [Paracoccus sp. S1E-3]MBA4489966.1 pre-peptidase C-terminal domain-containing protein [Paracoccus sp. S1E-3]